MSSTTYEEIRAAVHRLPREEQDQLLTDIQAVRHDPATRDAAPDGAAYVAFLDAMGPLDPEIAEEMERIIEEQFEHVDARE